jgi:hypothetical protein
LHIANPGTEFLEFCWEAGRSDEQRTSPKAAAQGALLSPRDKRQKLGAESPRGETYAFCSRHFDVVLHAVVEISSLTVSSFSFCWDRGLTWLILFHVLFLTLFYRISRTLL